MDTKADSFLTRIVALFLDGPFALLVVIGSLALGAAAVLTTPREEEPQIVVPVADVFVSVPGASAEEVEKLVATPLERLLWQVDGVEDVYSLSRRDQALVTVRFFVGEDRESSLVKLQSRIAENIDSVPASVRSWIVKPVEIDDVPILTLALWSKSLDDHALRRIAEEVRARLDEVDDVSRTTVIGGRPRLVRIEADPERLLAHGIGLDELALRIGAAAGPASAGSFQRGDLLVDVSGGTPLRTAAEIEQLVLSVHAGRPVYVRDVASVLDGPAEASSYARFGLGMAAEEGGPTAESSPSVTLAVSKKKGTNAVEVAEAVRTRARELAAELLPAEVQLEVTRDQGRIADGKVDELLGSLAFAMVSVVGLLILSLGWREGLVVALAVPLSFALALFVNQLFGYTINRVTLFALILTLGLVVDDPITNVDNIQRHMRRRNRDPRRATLEGVAEVLPPVLMSTLTVIVSFLPMFFISGMMGPYMQPMAVTVPLTVSFSTLAALSVVPWASYHLLKGRYRQRDAASAEEPKASPWLRRAYAGLVAPFLGARWRRFALLASVLLLLAGSGLLVITGRVPMKMLPFADKDELLLVVDLPEGTSLERTDAAVRELESLLTTVPEVSSFQSFVGTSGPIDFNGLVRHYYLREAPQLADVRIKLVAPDARVQQSHEIGLRLRPQLDEIAARHGALVQLVESPPGPPVLATLVAEVSGPDEMSHAELLQAAEFVRARMASERGVVDLDSSAEAARERLEFRLDREKAGLHGVSAQAVSGTLRTALSGQAAGLLSVSSERHPLEARVRLSRAARSGVAELERLAVRASSGELLPLGELGRFERVPEDQPILHHNLRRVVFVTSEMAGRAPGETVLALDSWLAEHPLPGGAALSWSEEGEWDITIAVFRDLGLAFGAALLGIYVLLVGQTRSFAMPMLIMTAIPLTAIGVLPGFWLLNLVLDSPIGGYANPVYFTATAMIGMIALGGIVVRNSIVLIEFIDGARREGGSLREAILDSGAVRMRPILLTAATTAIGAWPITLDPVFSGLAWSLIFGLLASTAFTLIVVPVAYYARVRATAA